MKRKTFSICLCLVFILSLIVFAGCFDSGISAEFVRFNIGKRNSGDSYLDFTIRLDNKSDHEEFILDSDFEVEINGKAVNTKSFLYEYEEVFIVGYPSVKSKEILTLRVRAIAEIKFEERNSILVKYKDKILVQDNVLFHENGSK